MSSVTSTPSTVPLPPLWTNDPANRRLSAPDTGKLTLQSYSSNGDEGEADNFALVDTSDFTPLSGVTVVLSGTGNRTLTIAASADAVPGSYAPKTRHLHASDRLRPLNRLTGQHRGVPSASATTTGRSRLSRRMGFGVSDPAIQCLFVVVV